MQTIAADLRKEGEIHELQFWEQFVNSDRFLHNWVATRPNPELEPEIDGIIDLLGHQKSALKSTLEIIDLGSGPVSILIRPPKRTEFKITATDPLADHYSRLWNHPDKGFLPTPLPLAGEDLASRFAPETFDVAHIRNALDHSRDPVEVYRQMISVTKLGGLVIVHGFENEAVSEGYAGFHQWNISLESGQLTLAGRNTDPVYIDSTFSGMIRLYRAHRKELPTGKTWITHIAIRC
jgi:SAM-dependent methyltransferase